LALEPADAVVVAPAVVVAHRPRCRQKVDLEFSLPSALAPFSQFTLQKQSDYLLLRGGDAI